jgi:hypothetical protein
VAHRRRLWSKEATGAAAGAAMGGLAGGMRRRDQRLQQQQKLQITSQQAAANPSRSQSNGYIARWQRA